MLIKIKRGDIFYADLKPVIGSEQGGCRPVVIIQNNVGNKHSPTVIVAPVTSHINKKINMPTHCYFNIKNGIMEPSIILLEQIRTIDKLRLQEYIGALDEKSMKNLNKALSISIGLEEEYKCAV